MNRVITIGISITFFTYRLEHEASYDDPLDPLISRPPEGSNQGYYQCNSHLHKILLHSPVGALSVLTNNTHVALFPIRHPRRCFASCTSLLAAFLPFALMCASPQLGGTDAPSDLHPWNVARKRPSFA